MKLNTMQNIKPFLQQRSCLLSMLTLALYLGAYGVVRSRQILVHQVTFESDSTNGKHYYHGIIRADYGIPLGKVVLPYDVCYFTFTPLRWTEGVIWSVIPRDDPL